MLYRLGPEIKIGDRTKGEAVVRITDVAQKCVVFFGVQTDDGLQYGGTGFLVEVRERGVSVGYVVTNKHVALRLQVDFKIRANLIEGGAEEIPVESLPWFYPKEPSIDLAAAPCGLNRRKYDQRYYALGDDPLEVDNCCGDPVNIIGLFRLHKGRARNVPIVHTGHVAALADRNEPVQVRNPLGGFVDTYAHLVEAQTLDGLSGSPVLIHRFVNLDGTVGIDGKMPMLFGGVGFFGIWQASWDGAPGEILAADRNLDGKGFRVPVGMGSVIPASCVRDLLFDDPDLIAHRARLVDEALTPFAQNPDSAFGAKPSGSNPKHREAFNSLLGAAAKTKRQDG